MSLSGLAAQHVARSVIRDYIGANQVAVVNGPPPLPAAPPGVIAPPAISAPPQTGVAMAAAVKQKATASDDRYDRLTKYIPTETITMFVAAMSICADLQTMAPKHIDMTRSLYWGFAFLTPVLLVVIDYGKHRMQPVVSKYRPEWWPLASSFIAFLVWAHSVPTVLDVAKQIHAAVGDTSALGHAEHEPTASAAPDPARAVWAVGATLISTLLGLLDPIFGPGPAQH